MATSAVKITGAPSETQFVDQDRTLSQYAFNWLTKVLGVLNLLSAGTLEGRGSPAGVVTAPVGTLYRRLDGGASTTLYVKESGTGTAGWRAV